LTADVANAIVKGELVTQIFPSLTSTLERRRAPFSHRSRFRIRAKSLYGTAKSGKLKTQTTLTDESTYLPRPSLSYRHLSDATNIFIGESMYMPEPSVVNVISQTLRGSSRCKNVNFKVVWLLILSDT